MFNVDGHLSEQDLEALEYFSKFAQIGQGGGENSHVFQVSQLHPYGSTNRLWKGTPTGCSWLGKCLRSISIWNERRKQLPHSVFRCNAFDWFKQASQLHFKGAGSDESILRRRANIRSAFTMLRCFLMPHPGDDVASYQYKGDINGMHLACSLPLILILFLSLSCLIATACLLF